MPRAKATESFVWRAASRPERARLLGAIAIAVSCGGLGVVAGRWSAQVAPADPGTRTAALIEAVAKETRAKLAAPGNAPAAPAAVAPPTPAPEAAPGGGQAASTRPASSRAPESGEEAAAEPAPAIPIARPATTAAAEEAQATRAMPAPASRRSQPAPTLEEKSAAPNYQALRDYVLSR